MAGILGLGKAETAPRCLACHALNPPAEERSRTFDVSEGVSCESCHGPASGWLGPHTERDWTHAEIRGAGNGGHARSGEAHGKMPELPSGQRREIRGSRDDRGRPPRSIFRAGFFFGGDAAALERTRRAGRDRAERPVVRRAGADHGTGRAAARIDAAAGVALARENLAGIFRNAVLRVPSQPDSAGAELAAGARLRRDGGPAILRGTRRDTRCFATWCISWMHRTRGNWTTRLRS